MQTIDLKNHIVQIFDSAEELIDHAKNVIQDENELVSRFIGKERTKFVGRRFDSWPAVYSAIRENWPEGQRARKYARFLARKTPARSLMPQARKLDSPKKMGTKSISIGCEPGGIIGARAIEKIKWARIP